MRTSSLSRRLHAAALVAMLCASSVAQAFIRINVTTTADEYGGGAQCSLREALHALTLAAPFGGCTLANGFFVDSIALPAGTYAIGLAPVNGDRAAGGAFYMTNSVYISGAGPGKTILDGSSLDRVIDIEPAAAGSAVSVVGVTVRQGLANINGLHSDDGFGVYANYTGTLQLGNIVVADNGALGHGSALYVETAGVSANAVTIMRNRGVGAELYRTAASEFDNVTISGNSSHTDTGGLRVDTTFGALTLNNSTIAYNTGDFDDTHSPQHAGGMYIVGSAVVNVRNTIVARNTLGSRDSYDADCHGFAASQGYNLLEQSGNCSIIGGAGNQYGVDPQLAPLFDYGSGVPTHALLPGSPARSAGNPAVPGSGGSACALHDARGVDRSKNTPCDIGAYEYHADFVVNTPNDANDQMPGDGVCQTAAGPGVCTLRAALDEANAANTFSTIELPAGTYKATLASTGIPNKGGTLQFTGGNALTLMAAGADQVVVDGNYMPGAFVSSGSGALSLHGLALIHGQSSTPLYFASPLLLDRVWVHDNHGYGTNGIYAAAPITIVDSALTDNVGLPNNCADFNGGGGGALFVASGVAARLFNTTFSGNSSCLDGGAIFNHAGTVTMSFTTIANNVAGSSNPGHSGGGIASGANGGSWISANTIISGNHAGDGSASDCSATLQLVYPTFTWLGDSAGCNTGGFGGIGYGDPQLTALRLRGGSTPTHGLLPGSHLHTELDFYTYCADADGVGALSDQRGVARYTGPGYGAGPDSTCDLGAYQGSDYDTIFRDAFE